MMFSYLNSLSNSKQNEKKILKSVEKKILSQFSTQEFFQPISIFFILFVFGQGIKITKHHLNERVLVFEL